MQRVNLYPFYTINAQHTLSRPPPTVRDTVSEALGGLANHIADMAPLWNWTSVAPPHPNATPSTPQTPDKSRDYHGTSNARTRLSFEMAGRGRGRMPVDSSPARFLPHGWYHRSLPFVTTTENPEDRSLQDSDIFSLTPEEGSLLRRNPSPEQAEGPTASEANNSCEP
jgi:hypothetical protein